MPPAGVNSEKPILPGQIHFFKVDGVSLKEELSNVLLG